MLKCEVDSKEFCPIGGHYPNTTAPKKTTTEKSEGATRKSSAQAHDLTTDVEDQNSEAVTVTSDSDDDSLMKSVLATSENNATKSIAASQERDDSQFSEIFRCFQEVLEQRDVQPLFVNVDLEEICHQAARAKKVLVLALFYPGNNDEHMARLLKCLAQFKSIYLWIDNAKSQTGRQ
ncbi:hypothetical protein pdam_00021420, partial [Pocillopora damicornis]